MANALPVRRSRRFGPAAPGLALALLTAGPAMADVSVVDEEVLSSVDSEEGSFRVVKTVDGLDFPWSVAWLPDGRMLITERGGHINLIDGDEVVRLEGVPDVHADDEQKTPLFGGSQGGMLDIAVHPDYQDNGWIYFSYSAPGDPDNVTTDDEYGTATAVARARLSEDGTALEDLETLYTQSPNHNPGRHYAGRLLFPGDGTFFLSIGDRGLRAPSQDLTDPTGSIIRLQENGGAAGDNPFIGVAPGNLRPEIWSFGHRNNQGLALHPETGELWASEHGPNGGDMLRQVNAGENHGWPQVTFAGDYSTSSKIGIGQEAPGVTPPVYWWEESRAPSGLAFYTGDDFPEWQNNLFMGSLSRQQIHRLVLDGHEVAHEEVLLTNELGRIRDVRQGPDGMLYILVEEENDGLYRIEPVD